jgi:predicted ribosome quality control (RQC) complex YloA/Tae2 family protein
MQTSLHIYSLVRELNDSIKGAVFRGTEFYKKEREAYLFFKGKKGLFALGLVYHPHAFGTFLIPRGKIKIETTEKPWPFFQPAYASTVQSIEQFDLDRIFKINLAGKESNFSIIVESIGPNGNFWLLDKSDKISATLRNKKYDSTEVYHPPPVPDKINPLHIELWHLIEIISDSSQSLDNILRKNILGLDKLLVEEIIYRAGLDPDMAGEELDSEHISTILSTINNITGAFDDYNCGYWYAHQSGNFAYPLKLRTIDDSPNKCKTLSLAVYDAIRSKRIAKSEVDEKADVLKAVERFVKKLKRKVEGIKKDYETAHDFEQYKKYAELIKIFPSQVKKGMEFVELNDVFTENGGRIIIELDPSLPPMQNAEIFFKKYRKGKDALALLERRLEVSQKELQSVLSMQDELDRDFDTAVKQYEPEIAGIMPKEAESRTVAVRLPYKEMALSTGVRIFVGRDGADNDSTTFNHAKPYELWFHASQCPGSHVVMKFPDKSFVPSKGEIAEAAAVAAYFSKAKNSKTVPVIYTQKKYVRKPHKAKPGLVTVEREKMVMVEPLKPA